MLNLRGLKSGVGREGGRQVGSEEPGRQKNFHCKRREREQRIKQRRRRATGEEKNWNGGRIERKEAGRERGRKKRRGREKERKSGGRK